MAFDLFCLIVLLMIPVAVLLSVFMGVAGCGCPISMMPCRSGTVSLAFINNAATSASNALAKTALIILASTWMGPLNRVLSLFPRKKKPPARLQASGHTKNAALLSTWSIISEALYMISASGLLAA